MFLFFACMFFDPLAILFPVTNNARWSIANLRLDRVGDLSGALLVYYRFPINDNKSSTTYGFKREVFVYNLSTGSLTFVLFTCCFYGPFITNVDMIEDFWPLSYILQILSHICTIVHYILVMKSLQVYRFIHILLYVTLN